jgi:cysteine desulfurase/selenocysteine lyase
VFKHQFPFFERHAELAYLDSAATTQKHASVIAAVNNYHQSFNAPVHRSAYAIANQATHSYEKARNTVAALINCQNSSQIVFNSGATESINTIANGLQAHMLRGNRILLLASEHHANILPWQQVSKRFGLKIEIVKLSSEGQFSQSEYDNFQKQLNEDVAIVAMAHVSNVLGNIYPVQAICSLAKKLGILTVIDGTQAIAHIPVDIEKIDCDFYVFSAHKMYGPTGVGVLYGKMPLLEALFPLKLGGEMITHASFDDASYQAPPLKFEGGTPNIAGVIGLGAAAEFLQQNIRQIQTHEAYLFTLLSEELLKFDEIRLLGNLRSKQQAPEEGVSYLSSSLTARMKGESIGLHSFVFKNQNLNDVAQLMYQQNIAVRVGHHCAMPLMQSLGLDGTMRVSIGCYTTEDDIRNFVLSLKRALSLISKNECTESAQLAQQDIDTKAKTFVPVVLPIAEKISQAKGWDNQYRQLLLSSKLLNVLPLELRVNENAVFGCESDLWIGFTEHRFCAYSQSKVIRGILALLIEKVENIIEQSGAQSAYHFDYFGYLTELNLTPFFSVGRKDGIQNAIASIKQLVLKAS